MSVMQMLGRIGLSRADGGEVDGLLRQPKRLALLAYLASPAPGTWHRRDTLLALFWPEFDEARARTALRNALYVLRRHLPEGTIRTRGDDDISVDPARLSTDVAAFEAACAESRAEEALAMYHGEFLPALFVPDAEGFEKWLDGERRRLRGSAHASALSAATLRESRGDWRGAVAALARAVELEPHDEASARRLMALYDGVGDRAQALAAFDRLSKQLDDEFGIGPSPETLALAETIRQRRVADPALVSNAPARVPEPSPLTGEARLPGEARQPDESRQPDEAVQLDDAHLPDEAHRSIDARVRDRHASSHAASVMPALSSAGETTASVLTRRGARRAALAFGGVAIAALALRVAVGGSTDLPPTVPHALMVAPFENAAGPALDYVAAGLSADLTRRLETIGGLRLATTSRLRSPRLPDSVVVRAGRAFGAEALLEVRLDRVGDSLVAAATAIDMGSGRRRDAGRVRFTAARIPDAASRLAASIAGTILRVPLPAIPGVRAPTEDPESYRLTVMAWDALLDGRSEVAQTLFLAAIEKDPLNARAHAGLSSAFSSMTVSAQLPWDEGARSAIAAAERAIAIDSTQGSAWGTLGIMRALGGGGVAEGVALIQTGIRMEPANAEVRLVLEVLYRHTWEWEKALDAIRVSRALDPLEPRYMETEATVHLCADRPDDALAVVRTGLRTDPADVELQRLEVRALARLGRWDEALERWRRIVPPGDTLIAAELSRARGEKGYWAVDALEHQRRLATALKAARNGEWVSAWRLAILQVGAGHVEEGLTALERAHASGVVHTLKLPCNRSLDRVRKHPRYLRLLAQVANDRPR